MKRNLFLFATAFMLTQAALAQTPYINEGLLSPDLIGTARSVGMGGAMGALGTDLSAMSSNPASVGLYRSSDVSLTFGVLTQRNKPDLNTDNSHMSFDQMGFVLSTPLMGKDFKFVNFGMNYQKKANLNQAFVADHPWMDNSLGLSQTMQMVDLLSNNVYSPLADLMYKAYLIDPVDKDGNIVSADDPNMQEYAGYLANENRYDRVTEGSVQAFDFNISTNYRDRVYLGLTVGVDRVDYRSYSTYTELYGVPATELYSLYNVQEIQGYGINAKMGIILRPFETSPFRIGLTVETPTRYNLESVVDYSLDVPFDANGNLSETFYNHRPEYDLAALQYNLSTPWKFRLSMGHTIGSFFAVGAEYEYADYSNMRQSYDDGEYGDVVRDNDMRELNRVTFQGVHSFKFGMELKLTKALSLRAGYNFYSSVFDDNAHLDQWNPSPAFNYATTTDYMNKSDVNIFTAGVGYRGRHFYVDAAYKFRRQYGDFYAFDDTYTGEKRLTPVNVDLSTHQVFFTLGYKF